MGSRQPTLSINLSAAQENLAVIRSMVGSVVDVSAVVKSDAYGLGLERLAGTLFDAGCESFFVGDLIEAERVRQKLSTVQIVVLSGVKQSDVDAYRSGGFTAVCSSPAEVSVASYGKLAYAMNLETGFGRRGLRFDEVRSLVHADITPPVLVMSHLACADDPESERNRLQRDRFLGTCEMLAPSTSRSLAASAGVSLGANYHFDRVRIGSALYGLNNAGLDPNPFLPVVSLSAPLIDVRQIHRGESVGYMGTFKAQRPTRLGIVAIGYRHGLAWSVANRLSADFGGYLAPIVGRVSMEYCAVDLTDIPTCLARAGARVDFITPMRPVDWMARSASTIAQELLVRLGGSCSRRYYARSAVPL